MVALGSYVNFCKIFQNIPGGGVGWRFRQTFRKSPTPFLWGGLQNMSAVDDENFDKSELIYG